MNIWLDHRYNYEFTHYKILALSSKNDFCFNVRVSLLKNIFLIILCKVIFKSF